MKKLILIFLFLPIISYSQENNYSILFDGDNDYVEIENSSMDFESTFTIIVDFKVESFTDYWQPIFSSFFNNSGLLVFCDNNEQGEMNLQIQSSDQTAYYISPDISTEVFYTLIIEYSNNTLTSYLNGSELVINDFNSIESPLANNLFIGTRHQNTNASTGPSTTDYFKGNIDNFSFWNTILTPAQKEDYINCSLSGTTENLIAYLNFEDFEDDGNGILYPDQTINGNNGVLYGGNPINQSTENCVIVLDEDQENTSNSVIGDVNCDGDITIDDLQLLSNIWNNLVDPDTLELPCLEDNITGLNPDQLQEMIDMIDEHTEINVVNYNENIPLGVILPYAGINPPEGWILCDGSAISRIEYMELFELLGTSYGEGDGTFTYDWQDENNDGQMDPGELIENLTTFNLPDFRGRVPVGRDENATIISNGAELGITGGAETHTLTIDEMPSHNHGIGGQNNSAPASNISGNISTGYGLNTLSEGGDQPHNNMPPYLITNYIIKAVDQSPADESEYDIDPQNEIQTLSLNEDTLLLSDGNSVVLDNLTPIGTINIWSGDIAPQNWMLCDGTEISRENYLELFNLIGIKYGVGDGFSTFNIPNLLGRVPVGKDPEGVNISNGQELGNNGGEEEHTLIVEELPKLSIYSGQPGSNSSGPPVTYQTPHFQINNYPGNPASNYPGGLGWSEMMTNADEQPHNNMQPYLILNYIIKVE